MAVVIPLPGRCLRANIQALDFHHKAATSKPILFFSKLSPRNISSTSTQEPLRLFSQLSHQDDDPDYNMLRDFQKVQK